MFSEILKIIPKIDSAELTKMTNTLGQRFTSIAKKFGKGLSSAVKGGAVGGIALGLIDKLLNPLKEVQESIEKSLAASDDLVTNAKQFGTTSGKLAKLQAFGKAAGLDPASLSMLMAKFQTSVAEAEADPTKQTSVRKYVGQSDSASAFFDFIQSLKAMEKNNQILVQQEVFGEKQILKMSDFLNSDFKDVSKAFAGINTDALTKNLEKGGAQNDYIDTRGAARDLKDIITKGGLINDGIIKSMENAKDTALARENERIKSYTSINEINEQMRGLQASIEGLVNGFFKEMPIVFTAIQGAVSAINLAIKGWGDLFRLIKDSRLIKGMFGGKGE
jgi:hypothetical protein